MSRILCFFGIAMLLSANVGCRMCDRPPPPPAYGPPVIVPPPPTQYYAPVQQPIQQSGAIQTLPPGAIVNPPPPPANPAPPPLAQPPSISKTPQEQTQWQPADGPSAPPRIEQERNPAPSIRLYAPEAIDKEPAAKKTTTLPPIGQFAVAKEDSIFTGLRPNLDGLDWLQANGVKIVINIRLPDKDDSADRTQIEKRKMRYLAFEISAKSLTKEKADEFVKLIRQTSEQRIFVYDEDGALAGSMWYLFARRGLLLDDDTAQIRAGQLGLETNRDGPHRDMWLAVQKLLSGQ